MSRRRRKALVVLIFFVTLVIAPHASATYDPLAGGATKFTLANGFLALLKQNGVKLAAEQPVKVSGRTVTFPVSGGKFDPTTVKGTVQHEGAVIFKAGARSVPLRSLQLKTTQRHAPFSAKVGGSQLKLASASKLSVAREGFGERVKASPLKLSAKFAERLDKKLHLHGAFEVGQTIGSTLTKASPATVAIEGTGKAAFTFSPEVIAKLKALFVAVNPIFPAEHPGAAFTLPIFGGAVAPGASLGTTETSGSLELLQLGAGQLFWHDIWIDLGAKTMSAEVDVEPSPPYAGKLGRIPVADLSLTAAAISSDPRARTVTVEGATATLQPPTAQTLNELFAKPRGKEGVFQGGELLGSFSFTAQGQ